MSSLNTIFYDSCDIVEEEWKGSSERPAEGGRIPENWWAPISVDIFQYSFLVLQGNIK